MGRYLRLVILGVAVVAPVAIVHQLTKEPIQAQQAAAELARIATLLPGAQAPQPVPGWPDSWRVIGDGSDGTNWILPLTTRGYAGPIALRLAADDGGRFLAVAIVAHTETPGLGDIVEPTRSDWLVRLASLARRDLPPVSLRLKRDGGTVDGISGATVTCRAIANALADAVGALPSAVNARRQAMANAARKQTVP